MLVDRVLRGDRVLVRAPQDPDGPAVLAILQEPTVARWWGPTNLADVLESFHYALIVEVDGVVAGWMFLEEEDDPMYRHVGLDVSLGTAHQGKGIGPEALRLVIRECAAKGHHRFTIDPAASNAHAIKAYTSLGFKPVGVLRDYERDTDGGDGWHDGLLMDLLIGELT
jgi:aminoglycoside 6'-N-acetyltransferase